MSFFSAASTAVQSPGARSVVSIVASAAATAMLVRSVARDYIPCDLSNYVYLKLRKLVSSFSSEITIVIEEFDGLMINRLFMAAKLYLEPALPPSATRIRVSIPAGDDKTSISMEADEEIHDDFHGVRLKWRFRSREVPPRWVIQDMDHRNSMSSSTTLRFYELSFNKKHRELVLGKYIEHIMCKAKEAINRKKTPRLFTLSQDRMMSMRGRVWADVPLRHPARFETLAMDENVKKKVMEDLNMFVQRREYYRRVGKAWKRGYLLFGPPGTGKSSLVAAMADHLNFDVYDLELTQVSGNSELKKILMSTGNRSILVVEDIDCTVQLRDRLSPEIKEGPYGPRQVPQVTLSGFLNFVDGLWSSCGDERIVVFTTNHKERLDHALLRPGRMDVHIHMSYCTPCGFRLLARNYLGLSDHRLYAEVEEALAAAKATPAEVAEELMKNVGPDAALESLLEFLKMKKTSEGPEETNRD